MPQLSVTFTVRQLVEADLPGLGWAGSGVPEGLAGSYRGEVDYLVVCSPSGRPVATGGVDYLETAGVGTLYQLHVHELLRACGIGTLLINHAEARIFERVLQRASLGVDAREPRPRPLYERLGYRERRRRPGGWDEHHADGSVTRYVTTIIVMDKALRAPRSLGESC